MANPYLIGSLANNSTSATIVIPVTTAPAATDLVVVCSSVNATSTSQTGISDTKGNTYAVQTSQQTNLSTYMSFLTVRAGTLTTSDTITCTFSAATGSLDACAVGVPAAPVPSLDKTGVNTSTSATAASVVSGSPLAQASEIAIAWIMVGSGGTSAMTWTGGFTQFFASTKGTIGPWMNCAWLQTATTGAVTASGTWTGATNYGGLILTIPLARIPDATMAPMTGA